MTECGICLETKPLFAFPCSKKHTCCDDCYKKLQSETCPYCRKPFISIYKVEEYVITESDPEPWLKLGEDWIVYSKIDRHGTEKIYTFKKGTEKMSWRNESYSFEVRKRRKTKRRYK